MSFNKAFLIYPETNYSILPSFLPAPKKQSLKKQKCRIERIIIETYVGIELRKWNLEKKKTYEKKGIFVIVNTLKSFRIF